MDRVKLRVFLKELTKHWDDVGFTSARYGDTWERLEIALTEELGITKKQAREVITMIEEVAMDKEMN